MKTRYNSWRWPQEQACLMDVRLGPLQLNGSWLGRPFGRWMVDADRF